MRRRCRWRIPASFNTVTFLRNFIKIMKLMKPVLSAEAGQILAEEFSNLRAMDAERGMGRANALTAWVMETMIRLATTHDKARAYKAVDPEDVKASIELVQYAYFGTERSRQRVDENGDRKNHFLFCLDFDYDFAQMLSSAMVRRLAGTASYLAGFA